MNSMLVRYTERMMLFNIQYTMSKCVLKCLTFCSCLFPLLARIAESPYREMYLARIAEIILRNYTVLRRMFGNKISFSCQSNLPFCGDDEEEIRPKTYRALPQASHGKIITASDTLEHQITVWPVPNAYAHTYAH